MNESIEHQALRHFPEYSPVGWFEAALPLFRLPIVTKIVEYQDLSVIAWYLLRAVGLGVDTPGSIGALLGLRAIDLKVPAAELLGAHLLTYGDVGQDGTRPLRLTEQGQQALREKKKQPIPRQKTIHLHLAPLTGRLTSPEVGSVGNADVRREGIFVLPHEGGIPRLADLRLADVREALQEEGGRFDFDVVALTDLKAVWTEYLRVRAVVLAHRQRADTRIAVFQGPRYRPDVSDALQRLHQRGVAVIPDDALPAIEPAGVVLPDLPPAVERTAAAVMEHDRAVVTLRQELQRHEVLRSATQVERERQELETQIARLERELAAASEQRDAAIRKAEANAAHPTQFISILEHRPLLENALRDAQSEVIILSPWMRPRAVDRGLVGLVRDALRRGVRIWIGYGARSNTPEEAERNESSALRVIGDLRRAASDVRSAQLEIVDLGAIHEKVLVCDRTFAAVGSFNWLSYRGDNDDGVRAETSVVLRAPHDVERLAEEKLRQLGAALPPRRGG